MILRDHSKNKIIEAMENNGLGWVLLPPPNSPKYEINIMDDMIRFSTGLNHPWGNWIVNIRFNTQNVKSRITENMKFYHEKELAMMWWISPSSTPDNLLSLLENAGLQVPKEGALGMACDLRGLTRNHLEEVLNKLQIKVTKITSENALELWGKVFQEGYSVSERIAEMFLNLIKSIENSYLDNYIAIFQEQPVAIASVLYYGGIAGIFNIATLPDYRGQGIGTAITLVPLMDAKKKDYEIAWLESSEMGVNLYKRIGFQEYCKFFRCIYTPEG
jgi:GNAT superfamily N-acetyltransferase